MFLYIQKFGFKMLKKNNKKPNCQYLKKLKTDKIKSTRIKLINLENRQLPGKQFRKS